MKNKQRDLSYIINNSETPKIFKAMDEKEEYDNCQCDEPKQSLFPDGKYYCLLCWKVWYH